MRVIQVRFEYNRTNISKTSLVLQMPFHHLFNESYQEVSLNIMLQGPNKRVYTTYQKGKCTQMTVKRQCYHACKEHSDCLQVVIQKLNNKEKYVTTCLKTECFLWSSKTNLSAQCQAQRENTLCFYQMVKVQTDSCHSMLEICEE